jgi:peptide/nickel transport system substrate-binding protein
MTRVLRAIAALAAVALIASACGDDDDAGTTPVDGTTTSATAPDSGECPSDDATVTMGVYSNIAGLDPVVSRGTGLVGDTENAALYDTLVRWDAGSGEYVGQLAEQLVPNDDLSEWTLTLREGVVFGNGDALDAEAVKASIERHMDPENRSTKAGQAANIATIEVDDGHTVRFVLTEPWGRFPYLLAGQVGMITNQRLVDERGDDFAVDPTGAGAGPFELERYAPSEEIVLRAKDDYWGGPVCIDTLRFISLGSAAQTFEGLEAGTIDVTIMTDAAVITRARSAGYEGHVWLQNMGGQVLMNSGVRDSDPVTADVRVRRAIAHAIDPEVINERAFGGYAEATSAIFANGSQYHQGLEGPAFDPDEARAIVAELTSEGDWDGSVGLLCPDNRQDEAIAIATMLESVGMTVQVEDNLSQDAQIGRVITDANFDLACWGNNMYDDGDPWAVLDYQLRSDSPSNYRGYSDPDWDRAVTALKRAGTLDETKEHLAELQQIWNDTIPSMNYRAVENFAPANDRLAGLVASQEGILLFHGARVEQ